MMNKNRFWLPAIILIALALRLYNLTYHSLWFDEAMSVYWARQTVPRILEIGFTLVEDRLPPLYYLTLKGWTSMFGFSETSVRSLPVFFGVLLAPVMANIAATLFNRRVACLTAALVALNPFLIWYSQETRMYAPAALFSALTVWAFLRLSKVANQRVGESASQRASDAANNNHPLTIHPSSPAPVRGVILHPSSLILHPSSFILYSSSFILFALAGLYTHLYTGFLLPALGLWLIVSYPRAWRAWLLFGLCGLVIALAFAPLALAVWRFSGESTPGDPFSGIGQRAWGLLQAFTIWKAPLSPILQFAIPIIFILFIICAYPNQKRQRVNYHSQFTVHNSSFTIHYSPLPHPPPSHR